MGKLRVLSGAEVCRILTDHGFKTVRQRGSHIIMQKPPDIQPLLFRYPIIEKSVSNFKINHTSIGH